MVWKSIILNSIKVAGYTNLLDISVVVFINIKDTDYIDILDLLPKLFFLLRRSGVYTCGGFIKNLSLTLAIRVYTFANLSATS